MLQRFFARIDGLPAWLQPAVIGALLLFAMVGVRVLFQITLLFAHPELVVAGMYAALLAAGAGACGGFAYSLIGRRLLAVPRVGRYLTGIVCVAAYLFPLILLLPRIQPDLSATDRQALDLHDPIARWVWLFCTLLFGFVVGRTWFDDPRKSRSA
jgi:hypothetical protein